MGVTFKAYEAVVAKDADKAYDADIEVSLLIACDADVEVRAYEDDRAYEADTEFATLLIVSESVVPSPLLNVAVASNTEDEI